MYVPFLSDEYVTLTKIKMKAHPTALTCSLGTPAVVGSPPPAGLKVRQPASADVTSVSRGRRRLVLARGSSVRLPAAAGSDKLLVLPADHESVSGSAAGSRPRFTPNSLSLPDSSRRSRVFSPRPSRLLRAERQRRGAGSVKPQSSPPSRPGRAWKPRRRRRRRR